VPVVEIGGQTILSKTIIIAKRA